jgi:hypothetical protein
MRLRLLAPLPLAVSFGYIGYIVESSHEPESGTFRLYARPTTYKTGGWVIGPAFDSAEKMAAAVFKTGFDVKPATIGEAVMRRLVADKRAEVVVPK